MDPIICSWLVECTGLNKNKSTDEDRKPSEIGMLQELVLMFILAFRLSCRCCEFCLHFVTPFFDLQFSKLSSGGSYSAGLSYRLHFHSLEMRGT